MSPKYEVQHAQQTFASNFVTDIGLRMSNPLGNSKQFCSRLPNTVKWIVCHISQHAAIRAYNILSKHTISDYRQRHGFDLRQTLTRLKPCEIDLAEVEVFTKHDILIVTMAVNQLASRSLQNVLHVYNTFASVSVSRRSNSSASLVKAHLCLS